MDKIKIKLELTQEEVERLVEILDTNASQHPDTPHLVRRISSQVPVVPVPIQV